MSNRIGIIAEGPIDLALLPPLVRQIAYERAGVHWPIWVESAFEWLQMRPRGHGGVWKAVQRIVKVLTIDPPHPYSFIIILLDWRTHQIQSKIRKLIAGKEHFILAVAKEEIEAWWLGDQKNTLDWLGFTKPPVGSRYAAKGYQAERDKEPKKTLNELTEHSKNVDRVYGEGNLDLAREFSEFWEKKVNLQGIQQQCPKQFSLFCKETGLAFRKVRKS